MLSQWQHILRPIDCGPMRLKNRLTSAPINTGLENLSNLAALADFYAEAAADGVSLVTLFSPALSGQAKQNADIQPAVSDDFHRYKPILKAVSSFDCRVAIELNHIGQDAGVLFPISSVPGVSKHTGKSFYAAPAFLIRKAIHQFAQCAQRAASVGFDAVEINASGRSLIASFLSPAINTRQDAWGTNQLGRFRFLLETVRSCKRNLPETKALGVRFNLMELSPKGAAWDEILRLIQMLRIAGADYLVGIVDGFEERVPTHSHAIPEGVWVPAYEALAQASDLPVFFTDPGSDFDRLEDLAQKHDNAVFSLSTPLLGDSSFIRKKLGIAEGEIRPWIDHHDSGVPLDALRTRKLLNLTNPCQFGRFPLAKVKTPTPKRIAVIGAGLAGMLFASIAAGRGHAVTLFEKSSTPGGQLHFIRAIEDNENYDKWLDLLVNDLKLNKVNVIYNKRVDLQDLKKEDAFDRFVIATGSEPEIPDIAGINASNVVTYEELLTGTPVGNRVAVLGNGRLALAVSRYLLENKSETKRSAESWLEAWGVGSIKEHAGGVLGMIPEIERAVRQLYLIELDADISNKLLKKAHNRWDLTWLLMRGAQRVTQANIELIDNHAVRISDCPDRSNRQAIRIDHVVVCSECTPNLQDRAGLFSGEDRVLIVGAASTERGYMNFADIIYQVYEKASTI